MQTTGVFYTFAYTSAFIEFTSSGSGYASLLVKGCLEGVFAMGQVYVLFSRVTDPCHLELIGRMLFVSKLPISRHI